MGPGEDAAIKETNEVTTLKALNANQRKKQQIEVVFTGQAYDEISKLVEELQNVNNGKEVVLRGLELLISARGKDIILKDKHSGASEFLTIWR